MKKDGLVYSTSEVILMPFLLVLLAAWLAGCAADQEKADPLRTNAILQSDRTMYYQQNVLLPPGTEPNATPYGTPTNFGTAGEYGRTIRPDAVSSYPGWEPVK